ncbi:hypothetical protein BGW37DRAFT_175696 [Umbelopsis sp. PMI_123]|nr:hypothetical protein BGW37DRAFT_175696 [Umbelopsis sp. PMI_123]
MVSQQQNQSHPSHNYGQLYTPYHQHSPESPFVDQSRYAHQRETSQDIMLEQRRRDFNNNNNFRPPQPRHVDDIPPFTSPIHMPSGKASQFETAGAGGAGGGGVYNEENNVLETATSSRSSSPGSRHQLQQQQQTPYQQQAVRLISPSAVTMSPPTPRADMPSHYFEESPTSPYHHRRESAIFDTPQRVASPRHHPYAPKPASSGKVFQQSSIANRLEEKKTSEELVEQQIPTSLTNQNAMENHHPSW